MTYQMSPTIASLAASLAKAQGELSAASMNADNPFFKSKYADLGSVWDACRGALSANGLAVIQNPSVSEDGNCVSLTTILAHSSGEWVSSTVSSYVGSNQKLSHAQAIGSIITYLRRYALAAMVGVYTGDDNDGNAPEATAKKRQPYAEQPVPTPPANGKPAQVAAAPEMTWDELANNQSPRDIAIRDGKQFVPMMAKQEGKTEGEIKDVAKLLGMSAISKKEDERGKQWDTIVDYIYLTRNEKLPHDLALAVINDAITLEEARKQVAKQPALIATATGYEEN